MNEFIGDFQVKDVKIGIVTSRFNETITRQLLQGALDTLKRCALKEKDIDVVWVPGAFEIPLAAQALAKTQKYDAIICLGAVIRGATPHFDYVCSQAASGIARISLEFSLPVLFGVLTTNTIEEAVERSGCKSGNKGSDVALAAVEMISLLKKIQ